MKTISTQSIHLTDSYVKNAQNQLVSYLLSMKSEKFLYEVCKVANIKPLTEEGYQGWERSDQINFRGHFFGHYISALSLAYHAEKDEQRKQKLLEEVRVAVEGLKKAQTSYAKQYPKSAGYISAFCESALDEVEGKEILSKDKENVLVPWYNLHKILAGLIDVYVHLKEIDMEVGEQALEVASQFGDYIYNRMLRLEDKNQMLKIEYGGMNDALYNLFAITKKREHMIAATYFDEDELFEKLANHENVLPGRHANTQIPKLIGASNRYITFQNEELRSLLTDGEKKQLSMYFEAAKSFWDIVIEGHTYCTGGHSQSEHFHEANHLYYDADIRNGDCTCETCNTHNMLKLTRNLYFLTKDVKYLDYYERTYINAILPSQNPETGMMMYFQPMGAGYNKVYNRPYDEFWCCTGTGVESFAKLADTYYFEENERIYVNLYFSNEVELQDKNIRIVQETDRRHMKSVFKVEALNGDDKQTVQIAFRIPGWTENYRIIKNDEDAQFYVETGFIYMKDELRIGDVIDIQFEAILNIVSTKDNENYIAFEYGPYVLAGGLGQVSMTDDNPNGIMVRVGTKERLLADTFTVQVDDWRENFREYMIPVQESDKLIAFQAIKTEEQVIFTPYYEMHDERYGIYFKLSKADSKVAQEAIKKKKEVIREQELTLGELHNFDENNSEYAKKITYTKSEVGAFWGRRYRQAFAKGSFSYEFPIESTEEFYITLEFHRDDIGKSFQLTFNDEDKRIVTIEDFPDEYSTRLFTLDASYAKSGSLKIAFESVNDEETPRIFGIKILKALQFSNQIHLKQMTVMQGEILQVNENEYELMLKNNSGIRFDLENDSSLVYIDTILVDEKKMCPLSDGTHTVRIYAQDHETKKEYILHVKNV